MEGSNVKCWMKGRRKQTSRDRIYGRFRLLTCTFEINFDDTRFTRNGRISSSIFCWFPFLFQPPLSLPLLSPSTFHLPPPPPTHYPLQLCLQEENQEERPARTPLLRPKLNLVLPRLDFNSPSDVSIVFSERETTLNELELEHLVSLYSVT